MTTKKTNTKLKKKPISDVARAGDTMADAASVPVIVTNRPMMKDPMMVEPGEASEDAIKLKPKAAPKPIIEKITLEPLAGESDVDQDVFKAELEAVPETAVVPVDTETIESSETVVTTKPGHELKLEAPKSPIVDVQPPDTTESPVTYTTPAETEIAVDDAEDDFLGPKKATDAKAKEARAEAEKQLALEKLITEGTYVVPINAVEKRRVQRTILISVLLMIALGTCAAVYVFSY